MNRVHAPLPVFDPMAGTVVLSPEKTEPGYWVGCPGILHDGERFWLTYRRRRPRGAPAERGWHCALAVGDDGVTFNAGSLGATSTRRSPPRRSSPVIRCLPNQRRREEESTAGRRPGP